MAVLFSTVTARPTWAEVAARIAGAAAPVPAQEHACRVVNPESHLRGEFPMDCRACHVHVNG